MKSNKLLAPGIGIATLVVLAAAPAFLSTYATTFLFFLFMSVALASSWNVISGYTGYVSFGHVCFFATGAYTTAILVSSGIAPVPVALVAGAVVAGILALPVGLATLRLRGPYFAIATLGLNELLRVVVLNMPDLTGGGSGISMPMISDGPGPYFAMGFAMLLAIGIGHRLYYSRFGLRLLSIREDEIAAEANGVSTAKHKIGAFVLSAIVPGLVGGVYAWKISYLEPTSTFSIGISVQMIIMTMFGGQATIWGPVIGGVALYSMQELIWARFPFLHFAIFGALLILVVLYMPRGIMGVLDERGIVVMRRIRLFGRAKSGA